MESDSVNPVAELFELRYYHQNGGITEAQAIQVASGILNDTAEARAIVAGSDQECATATQALVDR